MDQDERKNWQFLAEFIKPTGWMPVQLLITEADLDNVEFKNRVDAVLKLCRKKNVARKKAYKTILINMSDYIEKLDLM